MSNNPINFISACTDRQPNMDGSPPNKKFKKNDHQTPALMSCTNLPMTNPDDGVVPPQQNYGFESNITGSLECAKQSQAPIYTCHTRAASGEPAPHTDQFGVRMEEKFGFLMEAIAQSPLYSIRTPTQYEGECSTRIMFQCVYSTDV